MATVLVVDDQEDVLLFMESALGAYGHAVTGAVSGFEALDFLGQQRVDLVILDLRMPDITGLELLERIRRLDPDVPIIICSAYPALSDSFVVWNAHVAAVLPKPIDLGRLVHAVDQATGARGPAGQQPT